MHMTKLRALLLGALAALGCGYAIAQVTLTSPTLTGNEIWQVGQGIGGQSFFVTSGQIRNSPAMKTFSGAGAQTYQMVGADSTLFWVGTAPTTWTITTPLIPWDGQRITLATDTTLTTLVTLTPATGQTLQAAFAAQTVTAGTPVVWQYTIGTTKWQRIQ
jgi:hypothetical protein